MGGAGLSACGMGPGHPKLVRDKIEHVVVARDRLARLAHDVHHGRPWKHQQSGPQLFRHQLVPQSDGQCERVGLVQSVQPQLSAFRRVRRFRRPGREKRQAGDGCRWGLGAPNVSDGLGPETPFHRCEPEIAIERQPAVFVGARPLRADDFHQIRDFEIRRHPGRNPHAAASGVQRGPTGHGSAWLGAGHPD